MVDAQALGQALDHLMRVDPAGAASGCATHRCRSGAK
jgi:hypothetical protein